MSCARPNKTLIHFTISCTIYSVYLPVIYGKDSKTSYFFLLPGTPFLLFLGGPCRLFLFSVCPPPTSEFSFPFQTSPILLFFFSLFIIDSTRSPAQDVVPLNLLGRRRAYWLLQTGLRRNIRGREGYVAILYSTVPGGEFCHCFCCFALTPSGLGWCRHGPGLRTKFDLFPRPASTSGGPRNEINES